MDVTAKMLKFFFDVIIIVLMTIIACGHNVNMIVCSSQGHQVLKRWRVVEEMHDGSRPAQSEQLPSVIQTGNDCIRPSTVMWLTFLTWLDICQTNTHCNEQRPALRCLSLLSSPSLWSCCHTWATSVPWCILCP